MLLLPTYTSHFPLSEHRLFPVLEQWAFTKEKYQGQFTHLGLSQSTAQLKGQQTKVCDHIGPTAKFLYNPCAENIFYKWIFTISSTIATTDFEPVWSEMVSPPPFYPTRIPILLISRSVLQTNCTQLLPLDFNFQQVKKNTFFEINSKLKKFKKRVVIIYSPSSCMYRYNILDFACGPTKLNTMSSPQKVRWPGSS